MGGGELFQRIQEKQAFNERGKKFEYNTGNPRIVLISGQRVIVIFEKSY